MIMSNDLMTNDQKMPTYQITYRTTYKVKRRYRTLTSQLKVQAIGETHMRELVDKYGKEKGRVLEIIYVKEI